MPEGLEWFLWRPTFSQHAGHVSRAEIDERWSLLDLLDCHQLIDLHEEMDRRTAAAARSRTVAKR